MKNSTDLAGRRTAALGQGWREHRVLLAAGVVVAAVAAGVYLAALATHPAVSMLKGFDLRVYRMGGVLARQDPGRLYTWQQQPGIQFTYTPFAALVFALITPVPFRVLMDMAAVVSTAAVLVTAGIAFRELGWRGTARTGATLLVAGIAFWLEPVQRTLYLGQVELVQMAIIVWDLCQPDRRWWKGAATGVLAGLKLVPLIFIVYLLITRRFRQAATAAAAFAATVIAGFALLPRPSVQWWLHGYFLEAGRTGFVGEMVNQSLRGTLTRLAGSVTSGQSLWLGAALATGLLGLAAAALLHRAGVHLRGADGLRPDRAAHIADQLGSSLGVGRPWACGAHRRCRPGPGLDARGLASRGRRGRRYVRCVAAILVGRRRAASGRPYLVRAADGLRHGGRSEVRGIPLARPAAHRREPLSCRRRRVLADRRGGRGAGAAGRAAAAGQLRAYRGAGR